MGTRFGVKAAKQKAGCWRSQAVTYAYYFMTNELREFVIDASSSVVQLPSLFDGHASFPPPRPDTDTAM